MTRFALPLCLFLVVIGAAVAHAGPTKRPDLRPGEKVVLALLGMIGSEDPERVARAERLLPLQDEADLLRPLATALTCNPPSLRVHAAKHLARLGDERAARPLLHRVVRERNKTARRAMTDALARIDDPHSAHVLGRALWSRNPTVARNAAEVIGRLGDQAAAPYVIRKWEGRSGDFPRSYFTRVNQRSYIQDFDVEVASTSFIADPIIGVSQEGTVQPVKIVATEQIETGLFHATLVKLAGRDVGRTVGAWKAWWDRNEERVQSRPSTRR